MADDYGHHDDEREESGHDHLFLWTVFILLLIGMAFACWLGSFYIFGHPEKPRPYRLLKKLGKIEQPLRFHVTAAPPGEFLTANRLFERYSRFTPLQLEQENDELMRNYIKNFRETKKLVPYIIGRFEIIDTYELQPTDLFPSGVVAFASADDQPQVQLEHVFTAAPENVAGLRANLPRGLDMRLERTRDLAAIIHIDRTADGYLQFTAMPLLYGSWGVKGSVGGFSLEPPPSLNLVAGAPIIRGQGRAEAMRGYAEYRRSHQPAGTDSEPSTKPEPELVRVDTVAPGGTVPATGSMPVPAVATPLPVGGPKVASNVRTPIPARASPTPFLVASAATPKPQPTIPGIPATTPVPVATPLVGFPAATPLPNRNVPLKPFIASRDVSDMSIGGGQAWPTYRPGRHPAGRNVTASEASSLAEQGNLPDRIYLKGDFVVTAAGESRAVLRAQGAQGASSDPSRISSSAARIIVDFPSSIAPPEEGALFTRDEGASFEIREVRRSPDGQINIYVREISQAE